jgi:hypothetical protein
MQQFFDSCVINSSLQVKLSVDLSVKSLPFLFLSSFQPVCMSGNMPEVLSGMFYCKYLQVYSWHQAARKYGSVPT